MTTRDPDRLKRLPEPINLEDTVETHDVDARPAEKTADEITRETTLRYAGG